MIAKRFLLVSALLIALSINAAAATNIIVQTTNGADINSIAASLGGTVLDSIPGADTYLLSLPNLPLLSPTLQLLGVQWLELNKDTLGTAYSSELGRHFRWRRSA